MQAEWVARFSLTREGTTRKRSPEWSETFHGQRALAAARLLDDGRESGN